MQRASPTNATVLLLGESGVGKELVARTIHRNSPRAGQRFVQVNCAAIPEELIESELFGHEKGSFTGATEKQVGKFEQADRGTIFLDEVGDMSQKTQAKVLRVLQEQEVERLGSARTIKVDVRVIAATNKNLEEAIERGEFREDLYFRLNVIPIVVPPLRERRDDIPRLVQHFAKRTTEEHNLKPKRFEPAAMDALHALPLARQHPRAAQHHRAADDHDAGRRRCASRICRPTSAAASRPRAAAGRRRIAEPAPPRRPEGDAQAAGARHAARVQGRLRARLSRPEAAREQLEHLEDGGDHRHAAQQSLQEARTVRHQAGSRRIARTLKRALYGSDVRAGGCEPPRHATMDVSQLARRPPACDACTARRRGRKVRTPKGSAPGNARAGQLDGQWHRKYTALSERVFESGERRVRVKRCGKSAPRRR